MGHNLKIGELYMFHTTDWYASKEGIRIYDDKKCSTVARLNQDEQFLILEVEHRQGNLFSLWIKILTKTQVVGLIAVAENELREIKS